MGAEIWKNFCHKGNQTLMSFPLFYIKELVGDERLILDEDASKHIIQVLRMKRGEQLQLTDGKGKLITAELVLENKKAAEVTVLTTSNIAPPTLNLTIAISLIKNNTRFEWFMEKATEIGISNIIPLICERTEKQNFRHDRIKNILISAMLQSQQAWLPVLHQPTKYAEVIKSAAHSNKFIAHCIKEDKKQLKILSANETSIILIGPEGDFTSDEIELAKQNNYTPVTLGNTRLRTETAGIVAAVLLNQ
jgi:16S rRNA (uracil1498-N3)-methyltransferase